MQLNELQARQFLAKVLPWPPEGVHEGFLNLHWTEPGRDKNIGRPFWKGRGCRTFDELVRALVKFSANPDVRDIYICMSRQRDAKQVTSKRGYPYFIALRNNRDAIALKGVWADLDFKNYRDRRAALAALEQFLRDSGVPRPTVIVFSGGGLHLHWTFDRVVNPEEWRPIAAALVGAIQRHGLKCDTQCTIDVVRILRVPGTVNVKYDPPRPVELLHCSATDYTVEQMREALAPYAGYVPPRPAGTAPNVIPFPSSLPPKPPIKEASELAAGIEDRLLPHRPIANGCGFFRHGLRTGGADYANPLWHHSVLMTVFLEHGRELAHLVSQGHASYVHEDTEKLFDRKLRDHKERGIGWPSCQAIQQAGCSFCAACPHLAAGKSPLHLGLAPPAQPGQRPAAEMTPLPNGYHRNPQTGAIYRKFLDEDGADQEELITDYQLPYANLTDEPSFGWCLNLTAILKEHTREIKFPMSQNTAAERPKVLQKHGLFIEQEKQKAVGGFLMAWANHLQSIKGAIVKTTPLGWISDDNQKLLGFAYAGVLHADQQQQVPMPKGSFGAFYRPVGGLEPWKQAARLITNQHRPVLDAVLVTAFAAPLIEFTGQDGGLFMAVYSEASGLGKTTAIRVAQAVWGKAEAVSNGHDTENAIDKKLCETKNLPLYWDEMHSTEERFDARQFIRRVVQGHGKSRLNRNAELVEGGHWRTLLLVASNSSKITSKMLKGSHADLVRLFEIEVTPPTSSLGQLKEAEAQDLLRPLDRNYGAAGKIYAEWLGKNYAQIAEDVSARRAQFHAELGEHQVAERFWLDTATVLLLGARYANALGLTDIDESALEAFLIDTVKALQAQRKERGSDWTDPLKVGTIFNEFMEDARPHTATSDVTTIINLPQPAKSQTTVPAVPTQNVTYWVQIGRKSDTVDIRRKPLEKWCEDHSYNYDEFVSALQRLAKARWVNKTFGMEVIGLPIDSGVPERMLFVDRGALKAEIAKAMPKQNTDDDPTDG